MLVEYKKLKYGYHAEGWDEAYKNEYKDFQNLRLKLLIEDESIGEVLREIYKILLARRINGKPNKLLDIGCGAGHQLCAIAYLCDKAVGFDISEEIVKDNNRLGCGAEFVPGDALNHPQFKERFDVVLMAGVLYAIDEKRDTHKKILGEAYKSLADDGTFVFYHRAYLNWLTYIDKKLAAHNSKNEKNLSYFMCWFDDGYIKNILDEIGFEVVACKKADFAYPITATFIRKLTVKKAYQDYATYKSYNTYEKEYDSYKRLNWFGKMLYMISRYLVPSMSARTSIFILRKKGK